MAKTRSVDRQRHWREAIERQQASGQSIVGFCSKEGLAPASFHAWKRRLRRLPGIMPTDAAAMEALLPDRRVVAHPEHRLEQREEESRKAQVRRRRKRAARRIAAAQ